MDNQDLNELVRKDNIYSKCPRCLRGRVFKFTMFDNDVLCINCGYFMHISEHVKKIDTLNKDNYFG